MGVVGRVSAPVLKHLWSSGEEVSQWSPVPSPSPKTGVLLPPSHHKASSLLSLHGLPRPLLGEVRGVLNGTLLNGTDSSLMAEV